MFMPRSIHNASHNLGTDDRYSFWNWEYNNVWFYRLKTQFALALAKHTAHGDSPLAL